MKKVNCIKFWLNFIAVAVLSFVFFDIATTAKAEEFIISGYGPKEFAVKDDVEKQAKEMVESWGVKKPAKIIIQGFADKTGKTAENDSIARDRASELKAFLESKTNAKITAISKGESEDVRKVVVTVAFAVATAPVATETKDDQGMESFSLFLGITVAVILLLGLGAGIYWMRRKPKTETREVLVAIKDLVSEVKAAQVATDKPEKLPQANLFSGPIPVTIKEQNYDFFPEVLEDGSLKTCHILNPGEKSVKYRLVKSIDRQGEPRKKSEMEEIFRRSFRLSLNQNQGLFDELIAQGQLKSKSV
ncbi:MAG: hypothetical protein V1801_01580 [Candidatus Falkowbacteria bacterium]